MKVKPKRRRPPEDEGPRAFYILSSLGGEERRWHPSPALSKINLVPRIEWGPHPYVEGSECGSVDGHLRFFILPIARGRLDLDQPFPLCGHERPRIIRLAGWAEARQAAVDAWKQFIYWSLTGKE